MTNNHHYTENELEELCLEWFEELGYKFIPGPEIAPDGEAPEREDYSQVILKDWVKDAISRLNPDVPKDAQEEALKKVVNIPFENQATLLNNKLFHRYLTHGVPVEFRREDGSIEGRELKIIDPTNMNNNDWAAINQFTVIENKNNRRPDIVIFVNGLPLAVIELKNPVKEEATIESAYNQIQTYKNEIPSLFAYNEIIVISDGIKARIGSLTANQEWFTKWRTIDGKNLASDNIETMIKGVFEQEFFMDLITNFIAFNDNEGQFTKILAGYHQFHATNKAISSTIKATKPNGDKRCGVIWHTQGSGKSYTMMFFTAKISNSPELENPTIIMLTDRNDLDQQLFEKTFSKSIDLLGQTPVQAESSKDLKSKLQRASGGIIFTTIQKFRPDDKDTEFPLLSERRNIIFIADEAHRSQYDLLDGLAHNMRKALPNASFIGFTGTPISFNDADTRQVFGEYIDIYDIAQAIEDEATVPIYYEARLAKIELPESERPKLDADMEEITEGEESTMTEKLKSKWARLEALMGSDKRLKLIAKDIVKHFESRVEAFYELNRNTGKAMIVTMSRRIAVELYSEIIKLKPEWHNDDDDKGLIKVVMTGAPTDPPEMQKHVRNKTRNRDIANRMKDDKDELKLVIVRDMWLTGFDVPSMHTMYVDKPMKGHGLMQAIARVNRKFKSKQGGLIVDYLGIASMLKEAISDYTNSSGRGEVATQIEEAINLMIEKYEIVKECFHGFDYSKYLKPEATKKDRFSLLEGGIDFIFAKTEEMQKDFLKHATELAKAFSLCSAQDEARDRRAEINYFLAIKASISKINGSGEKGGPTEADYDYAIRQIVSEAIIADDVTEVFTMAGLDRPDISILSDKFLDDVRNMEHKNLALETLKKLLNDEIKLISRQNLVKSRKFSEMLLATIKRYQSRTIEAAQVVNELIEIAKKMKAEKEKGNDLGLSRDEMAFYDALAENESAVKELGDSTLKAMAHELVIMLRKSTTVDWNIRESVRAKIKISVKKLLRKYKYPPDQHERATQTVLEQTELICKDWEK
jgi:type I restriction enzyme R subunit